MTNIKILHFGDMHFDTPFRGVSTNKSEKRKEDLRETFGRIIRLAEEESVQIILLAGDLFDNSTVSKLTLDYMIKMFNSISHIKIFISPGNHDPFTERSFYSILKWPDNVYVFKDTMESIYLEEYNTVIYGIGFTEAHTKKRLLQDFKIKDNNCINIMVMHGDYNGGQSTLYNPIEERDVSRSNLDYLALGHKHSFSGINKSGNTFWAYSGNPEGRGFDETGSKGVILGEVGKGYVNLSFIETCKRKYIVESVDVTGVFNYEDIILKINEKIGLYNFHGNIEKIVESKSVNLFRVILEGKVDKDFSINIAVLEEKMKYDFFYLEVIDNTEVDIDYNSLANEFSLKGIYIKKIKEKIEACHCMEERKALEHALKIGLDCLESKEVTIYDN